MSGRTKKLLAEGAAAWCSAASPSKLQNPLVLESAAQLVLDNEMHIPTQFPKR